MKLRSDCAELQRFRLVTGLWNSKVETVEAQVDAGKDEDFKRSLDDVLGFYGMQLQSHAATLVGLSVAIFAVFSLRPGGVVGVFGSALAISLLMTGASYTLLRLVVYAGLSRTILYGNFRTVDRFANLPEWREALPQTKVSIYTHHLFNETWRDAKHWSVIKGSWVINDKDQPKGKVLMIIWFLTFAVTILFSFLT